MAHNLFEVDYCVLLWDFYLISFSVPRRLFARCCPAAGQLQLQSTNLATISNRQQEEEYEGEEGQLFGALS